MCVSAVVEIDPERLAAQLGLSTLLPLMLTDVEPGEIRDLSRRVEGRTEALVVRAAASDRLSVEPMRFNPYLLRQADIGGDMWARSLLTANHGLIVIRTFSEWVLPDVAMGLGLIDAHDIHCAYNRTSSEGRRLLANFTPPQPLLVPVLFDRSPAEARLPANSHDFVIISAEAAPALKRIGVTQTPLSLPLASALEWLHTDIPMPGSGDAASVSDGNGESFAIDFEDVLAEAKAEAFSFALYKSA